MSLRSDGLDLLPGRLPSDPGLARRLGLVPSTLRQRSVQKFIVTSKLYEPHESWTKRRSWWHQFTEAKLEGNGYLVLLCHDGHDAFHLLAVEKAWMLEHLHDFDSSGGRYHLFLSAETDDLFTDKRGQACVSFARWLVPSA